jgi:hypothetical protein
MNNPAAHHTQTVIHLRLTGIQPRQRGFAKDALSDPSQASSLLANDCSLSHTQSIGFPCHRYPNWSGFHFHENHQSADIVDKSLGYQRLGAFEIQNTFELSESPLELSESLAPWIELDHHLSESDKVLIKSEQPSSDFKGVDISYSFEDIEPARP